MVFLHIRILYQDKKNNSTSYSYEMDLSEEDVKIFSLQFQQGENVFYGGRWIDPFDIIETFIYQTEDHSSKYETSQISGSVAIFTQKKGMVVTRQFILKPPKRKKPEAKKGPNLPKISKNVFIVHGRETNSAFELSRVLKDLNLNPILLTEQPSGSLTIIEKLEKYSNVGYAFIILTPDDIGKLFNSKKTLKARARQNVILEFGYFIGILGRDRVACLYKGDIELPSDMHGVVYIQFNKSVKEIYQYIVRELRAVGYTLNLY